MSDPELPEKYLCRRRGKTARDEFCSLSKTAGFTGTRCGYTIVHQGTGVSPALPQEKRCRSMLCGTDVSAQNTMVLPILYRKRQRQCSVEEGVRQCRENLEYYRENARVITDTLSDLGIRFCGGSTFPVMSGLNARRTWIPGHFLTICCRRSR